MENLHHALSLSGPALPPSPSLLINGTYQRQSGATRPALPRTRVLIESQRLQLKIHGELKSCGKDWVVGGPGGGGQGLGGGVCVCFSFPALPGQGEGRRGPAGD